MGNIMQTTKMKYIVPELKLILIDNEISLSLESEPPLGPGEVMNTGTSGMQGVNAFKTEIC